MAALYGDIDGGKETLSKVIVGEKNDDIEEKLICLRRDILNTSSQMMTGYKFKYFVFNLTFIGWYILGALFFGLPQIWTMPYTEMSMVAFYEARIEERL